MSGAGRAFVIGTAGHIDHGKSSLVRALTGIDPDRLPEERRRGITIDLGFAPVTLPGPIAAAFVDVPGHERFVRTMVAGASGVDAALLVVALDEGPMPQTEEHLAILGLLGVRRGVVALTKADLVEPAWRDVVAEEVDRLLEGSSLAGAPKVAVSTVTGEGLDALRQLLAQAVQGVPPRAWDAPARLPVDRVFSRPGYGTVVTGTLVAGRIRPEDRLILVPAQRPVRVRGVQVHGREVPEATAGQRVALNLGGVGRQEVARGDVVAAPGGVEVSRTLAAHLRPLPGGEAEMAHGRRLHVHLGTAESMARLVLLDGDRLPPEGGPARLALDRPLAVAAFDRFVLRGGSPLATVGGGVVLDPQGARYRRGRPEALATLRALEGGDAAARLAAALAQAGRSPRTLAQLAVVTGLTQGEAARQLDLLAAAGRVAQAPGGGHLDPAVLEAWEGELEAAVRAYHAQYPLRPGIPREELRRRVAEELDGRRFALWLEDLVGRGRVVAEGDWVALPGHRPQPDAEQARHLAQWREALAQAGLRGVDPPSPDRRSGGEEALVDLLVAQGEAVRLPDGRLLSAQAEAEARRVLEALLTQGPVTAAAYRDALGVSRKVAVPLLEHFDRLRVTRRVGEVHVAVVSAPRTS